jgi:hypothetical protein
MKTLRSIIHFVFGEIKECFTEVTSSLALKEMKKEIKQLNEELEREYDRGNRKIIITELMMRCRIYQGILEEIRDRDLHEKESR